MITVLLQKLDRIESNLERKSPLELKIALLGIQQEIIDHSDKLSLEEGKIIMKKVAEILKYLQNK